MIRRGSLALGSFALCTLFACDTTPTAMINLDEGGEIDTFTRAPAPTMISVNVVDSANNITNLYSGSVSSGATINLADEDQDNDGYVDVVAWDTATGSTQNAPSVHGRTLPISFGALDSDDPLNVFVQRTGELARMPDSFDARTAPLVDIVTGRYLLVAGGTPPAGTVPQSIGLYDQLAWQAIVSPPNFPIAPLSLAMTGTIALLVGLDSNGTPTAMTYDFSDTSQTTVSPPTGDTFDDIIGGSTVYADDGTAYIVGCTRTTGAPTTAVLKVATDSTLSFIQLQNPRLNAAAVWIETIGVVVIGGSATAAGIEGIKEATDAPTELLGYPPNGDLMLSAALINSTQIVSGTTPLVYTIPCNGPCTTTPFAVPPVPLVHADYFPVPSSTTDMLSVGWEANGITHVFRSSATTSTELPLKVQRQQARGLALPNGAIGVIGGSTVAESFFE